MSKYTYFASQMAQKSVLIEKHCIYNLHFVEFPKSRDYCISFFHFWRPKIVTYFCLQIKRSFFHIFIEEDVKSSKILQNVKFDSSNGKMYEELGNPSSLSTTDSAVATPAVTAAAVSQAGM